MMTIKTIMAIITNYNDYNQEDEKYLHASGDSNDIHDQGVPNLISLY